MTAGGGELIPGMPVAGRFRLLASHGGESPLQFWHAVDLVSGHDVALTLVDIGGAMPEAFVHEILARTIRLRGLGTSGVAPVVEVLHTGAFGVVVSEWVPGSPLHAVTDAESAAGMMAPLAAAAEAAHRAGLVLSVDQPARLRVSEDGRVVLAFPASLPDATAQSDLRGLGCALYSLLVDRWPDGASQPEAPAETDPRIPFLISATAAALLRDNGGIGSAATLVALLSQAAAAEESTCRIMPPLAPPRPGEYAGFRNFGPEERRQVARRLVLRGGLGSAAAIVLVALMALGSSLNGFLEANDDTVAMDADKLGLLPPTAAPEPERTETVRGLTPGGRVALASAGVFSPDGSPDSPGEAGLAIDGKPDTAWSTDRYYDADPFPKFKPGVGLLVSLQQPTPLSAVTIEQDSTGSVIEIRGVTGAAPKALGDTVALTPPTPVQPGSTRIPVTDSQPVSQLVVWISKLGSAAGQNRARIAEIGIHAASPPA